MKRSEWLANGVSKSDKKRRMQTYEEGKQKILEESSFFWNTISVTT